MRPLEDVRIIAVEQYGAGPFGSVHLADLGAEVIKIENPAVGGDVARYLAPYREGEDSLFFQTFNRNKRSLSLDMRNPEGRSVFLDLVERSDAVYSNLRGDVPERIGLRYEHLKDVNPAVVCCSLSGYGMTGPLRDKPAYDYLLQGMAGWMDVTGEPGGPPVKTGLSLVDFSGGYVAALSLMAGLHAARRDGVGMDCDVALFDVAMGMLSYLATWHLTAGYEPRRTSHSAHPSLVPFQNFETSDGWIVIGCAKEKFWERLCRAIDRPDLLEDERFRDFPSRDRNREALVPILEDVFQQDTSKAWLERVMAAKVPCGPVNTMAEAFQEEQTQARGLIVEASHPDFGRVRQIRSPVRVGEETPEYGRAPERNADAGYVLEELLGYSDERIRELKEAGAFG